MSEEDAVIYCRASQDRAGAGLSVAGQEKDNREFAASHGLTVRQVFTDNDISASGKKRRPGYQAMLAYLAANPGTTVVVWHTDRLHRHLAELEAYIEVAEQHRIVTRAVRAGDLDLSTASGRMVARMLGVVARHELEHMAERRKAAKARAAAAGRWGGGNRPFGYGANGITVVPAEAALIRQGTMAILAGTSLSAVTRAWNGSGVPTSTGAKWHAREVSSVLRRPRNAGLILHQKKVLEGVTAEWPAIVDEDDWRAVRAILSDPSRRTQNGTERRWLLSGLALCGLCEQPMRVSHVHGNGREARQVYGCRTPGGGHVKRDANRLDEYITAVVIQWLGKPSSAPLLERAPAGGREAARLHAEITAARQRLSQAAEMFAAADIDAAQLSAISARLNGEIGRHSAQLARLGERNALSPFGQTADPAEVWVSLDMDRRRAVVSALMTVTVHPAPRGRPAGWKKGEPYFDTDTVQIDWHR